MAQIEIKLPSMGEGITEATITKLLVKEGDSVTEDQSVLEIATDKVDSELPSPEDGTIEKILVSEGDVKKVGETLVILATDAEEADPEREEVKKEVDRIKESDEDKEPAQSEAEDKKQEKPKTEGSAEPSPEETGEEKKSSAGDDEKDVRQGGFPSRTPSGIFLSPLVRKIASEEGVSLEELDNIEGSGENGRITKSDIESFLESRDSEKPEEKEVPAERGVLEKPEEKEAASESPADKPRSSPGQTAPSPGEDDKVIEMDRLRKLIADHMVYSKKTSPHVSSFIDADVTGIVKWREKNKEEFLKREKQKLTYTPLFFEAAAKALKDFPMVNVSVDGTKIIVRKNINIGMATALPDGNLIVPVIKNADEKSLLGLVRAVNDMAERARAGKLKPDEISGGTFTITNFGTFRNTTGTPIINQPQAAILGVGAIIKKPAVIETPQGDAIAIRHIITLSISYDHRVIDGALGGMFLERVAHYLENFHSRYPDE